MLELSISKNEILAKVNRAFDIRVDYYDTNNGVINMNDAHNILRGYYMKDISQAPDFSTDSVINELAKNSRLDLPIIIFNSVNIDRELTEVEEYSREALQNFFKTEINKCEISVSNIYKQVVIFSNAVKLLKNTDKVKGMLPVNFKTIAFIVMDDTEEDFILKQEANFISSVVAPNNNKFNIYKL